MNKIDKLDFTKFFKYLLTKDLIPICFFVQIVDDDYSKCKIILMKTQIEGITLYLYIPDNFVLSVPNKYTKIPIDVDTDVDKYREDFILNLNIKYEILLQCNDGIIIFLNSKIIRYKYVNIDKNVLNEIKLLDIKRIKIMNSRIDLENTIECEVEDSKEIRFYDSDNRVIDKNSDLENIWTAIDNNTTVANIELFKKFNNISNKVKIGNIHPCFNLYNILTSKSKIGITDLKILTDNIYKSELDYRQKEIKRILSLVDSIKDNLLCNYRNIYKKEKEYFGNIRKLENIIDSINIGELNEESIKLQEDSKYKLEIEKYNYLHIRDECSEYISKWTDNLDELLEYIINSE